METRKARLAPFLVAVVILGLVCIAMARLPDAYASHLARNSPFTSSQVGWAYRLLVLAALAQAAYGGFVLLQIDKVRKARTEDRSFATLTVPEVVRNLARVAAVMSVLTLVYGIAAFYVGGERGGFWLFALIAAAQVAWYFRQVRQIAAWLELQPPIEPDRTQTVWEKEPPDYLPPLAR